MTFGQHRLRPARQGGQAMLDYLIICTALAFFLFYPIADDASGGQPKSTMQIMLEGFQEAYHKIAYALSIP